jgi:hypothetical protein
MMDGHRIMAGAALISGVIVVGMLAVFPPPAIPENCVVQQKIEEDGPLSGRVVLAYPGYRDQVLVYDASCSSGMRWMNLRGGIK